MIRSYHRFYLYAIMGFFGCGVIIKILVKYGLVQYALGAYFHNWILLIPLSLLFFWSCLCVYLGLMKAKTVYIEKKLN